MGTYIRTISISPIWDKVAKDFNISPSKAFKDGLCLQMALKYPDFPRNDIEEALYNDSTLPAYKAYIAQKVSLIYGNNQK